MMDRLFSFCMCKKANVEDHLKAPATVDADGISGTSSESDDFPVRRRSSITDYRDVKVRFTDSEEEMVVGSPDHAKESGNVSVSDQSPSVVPLTPSYRRTDSAKSQTPEQTVQKKGIEKSSSLKTPVRKGEITDLHDKLRQKRIALRKVHAKLKMDLNTMLKMKEVMESSKCAASANLPDVITTEQNCSYGDYMREFRQLYENALREISEPTKDLGNMTSKYSGLLVESDDAPPSEVQSESQRLMSDSERMVSMLNKAAKVATLEYKLKLALSEKNNTREERIQELETTLLEFQQLKNNSGISFKMDHATSAESPTCLSIRDTFAQLFPIEKILKIEKRSKLKLAELHIEALENRHKQSYARDLLSDAMKMRNEKEIILAMEKAQKCQILKGDQLLLQAENLLREISNDKDKCRKAIKDAISSNSVKDIRDHLVNAESLHIDDSDALIEEAKLFLVESEKRENKLKTLLKELRKAMKKKDSDEIQRLLVDIKAMNLTAGVELFEEATQLLMYMKDYDAELKKESMESARLRLVGCMELNIVQDIANALVKAEMAGLGNCVEIMGARARLAKLQNNKGKHASELKKFEDYLKKITTRAADDNATVELITTLERANAVARNLEVTPETKQRAREGLHILKERKERVKSVKDELQRAVMECRQEAITCAIAEAESLPYFLTFDPLDGQIGAILEYAKNKITPQDVIPAAGEPDPAIRRVRSNLKRAMKGSSSAKLESAISLCRKTYGIKQQGGSSDDATHIITRAERKLRRMKKQELLAEKEWKNMRDSMRASLRSAMEGNDRAELWKAVYQFKRELGSSMEKDDEKLLLNARKHLREVTITQFKSNLSSALQDRDSTRLRHSLVELDSPSLSMFPMNEDSKFKDEVDKAKKLLEHLKDLERFKKAVSEMSRSQLAEIHRYPNPPTCVRAVMTATYILLGEKERDLKDWTSVLRLLVKMGRESLTRRVAICSPSHIAVAAAQRAAEILSSFKQTQVQDINRGAAVFFGWAKCVIAEVLDQHKDDPVKPALPPKQKSLQKPKDTPKDPVKSEFWNRLSRPRSSASVRTVRSVKIDVRPTSAMK